MPRAPSRARQARPAEPELSIRIDLDDTEALGPGKARLLELIGDLGSISSAGRAMGMSYRRAWLLIDELNGTFKSPLVETQKGGGGGGGAQLTASGRKVIRLYRAVGVAAARAAASELRALRRMQTSDE
ncbi:MAG TPA: LysR family transcriptional regulator [Vineibacter sp.]|nr:LysR family transcriptional regulator [Vineibacter sp.]